MSKARAAKADIGLLRRAMDKTGTNANRLARELGRDSSYIYNLLNGKKKSIAAGDALKLEQLLRLASGALFNGAAQDGAPKHSTKSSKVEIELSRPVARRLEQEAILLGVTLENLIKVWIGDKVRSIDVAARSGDPRRSIETSEMSTELRDLALEALDQPYES